MAQDKLTDEELIIDIDTTPAASTAPAEQSAKPAPTMPPRMPEEMIEAIEEQRRSAGVKALVASLITLLLGALFIFCIVMVFSAKQCSEITSLVAESKLDQAAYGFSEMNPLGQKLFGKKVKQAFTTCYEDYLDKGYTETACVCTKSLDKLFDDFNPADYVDRLIDCAIGSVQSGDYAPAAEAVKFISENIPDADTSELKLSLEAEAAALIIDGDFDSVKQIIKSLDKPNLTAVVKNLSKKTYDSVYGVNKLKLVSSLGDTLEKYKAFSDELGLSAAEGGKALNDYIDYYAAGCAEFGPYYDFDELIPEVSSKLDSAKRSFKLALDYAGNKEQSHVHATAALASINEVLSVVQSKPQTELVSSFAALCESLADSAEALSKWEDNSIFISCMDKYNAFESGVIKLQSECSTKLASVRSYSDPAIDEALKAVFN